MTSSPLRLNVGSAHIRVPGFINVDRYAAHCEDPSQVDVVADIADLPFDDDSADEILASHVLEHVGFADEERAWRELARVLRPGGTLTVEVPDFEKLAALFLAGEEGFAEFWQGDRDMYHFFGRGFDARWRWGIVTEFIFGNQRHEGEFHRNAYTAGKIVDISRKIGLRVERIERTFAPLPCLRATLTKPPAPLPSCPEP